MKLPITLSFKLLSLTNHIQILSSSGNLLGYARQKMFKLKEDLRILSPQDNEIYNIQADRIWDFSPTYSIFKSPSAKLGSISREGLRSLWSASYQINAPQGVFEIHEENPWVKFLDSLVGQLPIIGIFTGYLFHPAYIISHKNTPVARLEKQPAFWEGRFELTQIKELDDPTKELLVLGSIVVLIMERSRG